MVKVLLSLVVGAVVGAAGALTLAGSRVSHEPEARVPVNDKPKSECELKLAEQGEQLRRLSEQLNVATVATEAAPEEPTPNQQDDTTLSWRVSAIEKFVPLSDQQKERLERKFSEERQAAESGRESEAESLEEIIGEEQAATYRQGVQAAFDRVENEELEKETVWVARKVGLSPEQEGRMREVFSAVEKSIDSEFSDQLHGASMNPKQRVTRMIAENKRRVQLRSEALKGVLSNEQYQEYLKLEAQSAASDVEIFHN